MSCDNGSLSLQTFLPYRLSALSNRVSQSLASKYSKQFGISVQEWRIVAVLGESKSLSAVSITNRIAMDKVAVSRAVKKLLSKELVIKYVADGDNRRYDLQLSEKGIALYQQLVPIALSYEQKIMAQLSDSEQQQIFSFLNKLDAIEL